MEYLIGNSGKIQIVTNHIRPATNKSAIKLLSMVDSRGIFKLYFTTFAETFDLLCLDWLQTPIHCGQFLSQNVDSFPKNLNRPNIRVSYYSLSATKSAYLMIVTECETISGGLHVIKAVNV